MGRRIGAFFLAIPLIIVTLVIGYLIWGLVSWGKGTSPALRTLKMKVVNAETGQVVGWGTMALRNILGSGIVEGILDREPDFVHHVLQRGPAPGDARHDRPHRGRVRPEQRAGLTPTGAATQR